MLDWTDRHCRYFHRLLSEHALLYTEMVTTGAIIHGKADYLAYNDEEHPLALQLGGSNPTDLAHCAKLAQDRGYDEVNLNVGCPSDRVQNGRFGACLMGEAELVAQCVSAMREVVDIPVTVKTRIGIDEQDSYQFLTDFIGTVSEKGGCDDFTIHARKAWLSGLSPKENREIPPLDYPRVYQLKRDFPHLTMAVNGGVKTLAEIEAHLEHLDGAMVGREAYQNPYMMVELDQRLFGSNKPLKKNVASWLRRCTHILSARWLTVLTSITFLAICWVCSRTCRVPDSGVATLVRMHISQELASKCCSRHWKKNSCSPRRINKSCNKPELCKS